MRFLLLVVLAQHGAAATKVMQIGDSWTELSLEHLATYCKGATTVNKGVSSSTAKDWGDKSTSCPTGGDASCNAVEAFDSQFGSGYTHLSMSVGANDYMDGTCVMPSAELTAHVTKAIDSARSAAPSGIKIVLHSYCTPTNEAAPGCTLAKGVTMNSAIKAAADAASDVTFVDGTEDCGGTATSWSPGTYHADAIHLNQKGYCKTFTRADVQAAYGCEVATLADCGGAAAEATDGGGGGGGGIIIGIAVGAVAALALVGFVAYKMCHKPKATNAGGGASAQEMTTIPPA